MCEAHRRYLLYRLGLAGGNSTASDKAQHKSRVDEWVHRMRYTYFPKQELKFSPPENMFLSFYLDGWSVPRRALGKCEVLTLPTASGRSDQSHRLAPMV